MTHPEEMELSAPQPHARPNYLLVYIGLALLTAIEIGISQNSVQEALGLPTVLIMSALIAFMIFKAVLVAMFYMHLRMDSRWFSYIFLIPLPFVALILLALVFSNVR